MGRFRLTRREWLLFLTPCILLVFTNLDRWRASGIAGEELVLTLNPFAKARENARRSSCQSNLKQLALGLQQYQQDYDERLPLNPAPTRGWVQLILPYTKSCPILQCPSETSAIVPMTPDYWMNGNLNDPKHGGRGLSLAEMERPENTILQGDGNGLKAPGNYTLTEKNWQSKAQYAKHHLFGANYSFVDGHVKWIKPAEVNAARNLDACCTTYAFKPGILGIKGKAHDHQNHDHSGHEH